ncbi:MAG TPA: hypothetical protein VF044_04745, partial [Actinomycetota bacterium]
AQLTGATPEHLGGMTFRYRLTQPLQAGPVVVTFVAGSWSFIEAPLDGSTETTVQLGIVTDGDAPFIVELGAIAIIVPFPSIPAGYEVVLSSLSDFNEFTLGGEGLGTIEIDQAVAPIRVDATRVRYAVTGAFAPAGAVTATFKHGTWSLVRPADNTPAPDPDAGEPDETVTLGAVDDPAQAFIIFGFAIDVPYPVLAGYRLDPVSVPNAQFVLGGPGLGTVQIDDRYAPEVLGDGVTVRYRITGDFALNGAVTATFTRGTWSILDPAGAVSTVDLGDLTPTNDRTYVDVVLTPTAGGTLDPATVLDVTNEISLGGTTVTLASGTPLALGAGRYRYFLTGSFSTGAVSVTFAAGSFATTTGIANLEATQSFTVLGPTATPVDPPGGSATGPRELNDRGYVDVPFVVPGGKQLDHATVTDEGFEIVLGGPGAAGLVLHGEAPVLVATNGNTFVYRYWTRGTYTGGDLTISFLPGSFAFVDGSPNDFVGPVAPESFLVGGVATPNLGWLDAQLAPTAGDELDLASIADAAPELALSGAGAGTIAFHGAAAPTQLPGSTTFRFYITGAFAPGAVDLAVLAGSFSSGGVVNLASEARFFVQQLTGSLADPPAGTLVDSAVLNDRGYIDVTYTVPAYATALDVATVTDLEAEFSIAPAAAGETRTIALDATRAPLLVAQAGSSYTFRYFVTGTLRSGDVKLTFVGGSLEFVDAADNRIPLFAPHQVTVQPDTTTGAPPGRLVVDVAFGSTPALDNDTISDPDPEFTIAGATVTLLLSPAPGVYRYAVSGTGIVAGSTLNVVYSPGSWTYAVGVGHVAGAVEAVRTLPLSGNTYLDVVFASVAGVELDEASILDATPELAISGGVALADEAPTILDGGRVRYYLTGSWAAGPVTVSFLEGSWADEDGNLGVAGSERFTLVEALQDTPAGATPSKVFFIDISGGMQLWFVPLVPDEPVLEIRGKVTLEFGKRTLADGTQRFRFTLDASGTIDVYKIGNIASGAASFVLETGGTLGTTEFWGVAAFATNLDFLLDYGIELKGSILLQINTTDRVQRETITLEGVPGGVVFAVPVAGNPSLLSSLPSDTFNPVALSSDWVSLFASLPADRDLDGLISGDAEQAVKLFSGRQLKLEGFDALSLANATIEGFQAGQIWRIVNGDGKQFYVEKSKDLNGADILLVRGETRTYDLAPESFQLEVVGKMAIHNPNDLSLPVAQRGRWLEMDGAFLVRITTSEIVFFITAGASIDPLALDGRVTGLVIARGPPTLGIGALLRLDITAGTAPGQPTGSGSLSVIPDVFAFTGRVQLMLNTTRTELVFDVPESFLDVLPTGFPTQIKIFKSAPALDGRSELNPSAGGAFYVSALIEGSITLGPGILTLSGFVGITLQGGAQSLVRISGAVSTNVRYLGALSGSLDFVFYGDRGDGPSGAPNPGIVGRVTLALQAGGIIPGVSISGQALLEVNMFLFNNRAVTISTFMTRGDAGEACTTATCDLLALNPDNTVRIGDVTIQN